MGVMTSSTQHGDSLTKNTFSFSQLIAFVSLSGTDGMGLSLSPSFLSVAQTLPQQGVRASIQKNTWAGQTAH